MARMIERLDELTGNYEIILCDVWGVVHNGVRPFPQSVDALRRARERGVTVVLITNSPGHDRTLRTSSPFWASAMTAGISSSRPAT